MEVAEDHDDPDRMAERLVGGTREDGEGSTSGAKFGDRKARRERVDLNVGC